MSLVSAPLKFRVYRPGSRHIVQSVGEEQTTGVKHTHLGNVGLGYSIQKGPTDAIGSMTLTLTNVVVNSRYRIELQSSGALASPTATATGVASTSTVEIPLDVYAPGNSNNDITIKVRKGSSPYYRPLLSLTTLSLADQSVYIAQIPDA